MRDLMFEQFRSAWAIRSMVLASVLVVTQCCCGHVTSVVSFNQGNPVVPAVLLPVPPVSALDGALPDVASVWEEQNDVVLTQNLPVDVMGFGTGIPGGYTTNSHPFTGGVIPAGTKVSSFMIHFDTLTDNFDNVAGLRVLTDENIIGAIFMDSTLDTTDSIVGGPTVYPHGLQFRGTADDPSEGNDNIVIGVPGDLAVGYSQSVFVFTMEVQGALDELRIITLAPAPEPCLGVLPIATLMLSSRRRSRMALAGLGQPR